MAGAFVFAEAAAAAIGVVEGLDTGCDIVGPHATIMLWNVSERPDSLCRSPPTCRTGGKGFEGWDDTSSRHPAAFRRSRPEDPARPAAVAAFVLYGASPGTRARPGDGRRAGPGQKDRQRLPADDRTRRGGKLLELSPGSQPCPTGCPRGGATGAGDDRRSPRPDRARGDRDG
jgi:hypothetical protein